jgi:hypothetical protein
MKELIKKQIGGDGASVAVTVDEANLNLQVSYPLAKLVEPVAELLDKAIDKVEALIPGDQKGTAQDLKAEVREQLAKLLGA